MNRMQAIERYLDELDLRRLEHDRVLTLEGWQEPEHDLWHVIADEDE